MGKIPYLYRRNNKFYFRFTIPSELRHSVKVREIFLSLKTENHVEAIPLALKLGANVTEALHDLRTGKIKEVNHSLLIASSFGEPVKEIHPH